jgi:hypothetical protein
MEFNSVQAVKGVYLRKAGKWVLESSNLLSMSVEEYNRFISADTLRWFRNLGSAQHTKHNYTSFGWKCVQLVSVSPDESEKHEYNFRFIK